MGMIKDAPFSLYDYHRQVAEWGLTRQRATFRHPSEWYLDPEQTRISDQHPFMVGARHILGPCEYCGRRRAPNDFKNCVSCGAPPR